MPQNPGLDQRTTDDLDGFVDDDCFGSGEIRWFDPAYRLLSAAISAEQSSALMRGDESYRISQSRSFLEFKKTKYSPPTFGESI